ncbi:MAG: hypothetical protein H0W42_03010 [Gemmatimonadaceae bacterium]|nr:hypothetical protein [Gemmatimonadaceae bacterium]
MAQINTTHGPVDEAILARTVGFEDRPGEFVVWVEWRHLAHDPSCEVCRTHLDYPRPDDTGAVLVRRDAHCILKDASVVADVVAAMIG